MMSFAPSPLCNVNTVQIRRVIRWDNTSGGRVPVYALPEAARVCSVQPAKGQDVPDHLREAGVLYHKVIFSEVDPQTRVRDQILWNDEGNRILTVIMPRGSSAGHATTWPIICEERPA